MPTQIIENNSVENSRPIYGYFFEHLKYSSSDWNEPKSNFTFVSVQIIIIVSHLSFFEPTKQQDHLPILNYEQLNQRWNIKLLFTQNEDVAFVCHWEGRF